MVTHNTKYKFYFRTDKMSKIGAIFVIKTLFIYPLFILYTL